MAGGRRFKSDSAGRIDVSMDSPLLLKQPRQCDTVGRSGNIYDGAMWGPRIPTPTYLCWANQCVTASGRIVIIPTFPSI